jgi:hypothetical protein
MQHRFISESFHDPRVIIVVVIIIIIIIIIIINIIIIIIIIIIIMPTSSSRLFLAKEAEHVEGFAKECAVVTHHR